MTLRTFSLPFEKKYFQNNLLNRTLRKKIFTNLKNITYGFLTITDQDGTYYFGSKDSSLRAHISMKNLRGYFLCAVRGSIGSGEAYALGDLQVDDLTSMIRIFCGNRDVLNTLDSDIAKVFQFALKNFTFSMKNELKLSKQNISFHYDLSDEFFKLFLDRSLAYSSGVFLHDSDSLEQASIQKFEALCASLDLKSSDHLIEIGSGWGALAFFAAKKYGCRVTTTTISENQFKFINNKVRELGLQNQVIVLNKDFRELSGKYSKLVSVEMIEAVGHKHFETFLKKCDDLLTDDGLAAIQAITIKDQYYEQAKNGIDFIQKYIFPGGALPSLQIILNIMTQKTSLTMSSCRDITHDYAKTLEIWKKNFSENLPVIRRLGFTEEFLKVWDYYFSYCSGGFSERVILCYQWLFTKPKSSLSCSEGRLL